MLAALASVLMEARLRLSNPTFLGATGWRNVAPLMARSVAFAIGMVAAVEAETLADRAQDAFRAHVPLRSHAPLRAANRVTIRPGRRAGPVAVSSTIPVRLPLDDAMASARR
jgi:hypothetical protein